jgi:translocation and assembly module TamB
MEPVTGIARPAPLIAALRLLLPLAVMGLLVLLGAAALVVGTRWMLATENGTRWLLGVVPGVQVQGLAGALAGERLRAERLEVAWDGGRQRVRVENLDVQGLRWSWRPAPGAWLGLTIDRLDALRVTVETGPRGPRPIPEPATLAAPLLAELRAARVEVLQVDRLEPIATLALAELVFDGRARARHRIGSARAAGYDVQIEAQASIANARPYAIEAGATVVPRLFAGDAPPWAAVLRAGGPLARLDLQATLRGAPPAGRAGRGVRSAPEPQAVDLQARLHPLEAWVLASASARTEALDLSALVPGAPQTRLAGRVEASALRAGAPLAASAEFDNRLPGRWNEGRAPVARLSFDLRGDLARPDRVEAPRFEIQLADAGAAAGLIGGRGVWQGSTLEVDLRLERVTPQRLDSRAAAMTLGGPLQLTLRGLPPPPGAAGAAAPPWQLEARLDVEGRLDAAPTAVQLLAEASASSGRIELSRLRARSGSALAELKATLTRSGARGAGGTWQLASSGSLADFDPLPWWPGSAGNAWRQGPHRFNAGWEFDLRAPGDAPRLAPLALAQRLAGNGRLRIHESLLAGVALAAEAELGYTQAGAAATGTGTLRADLTLGGNRIRIDGRGNPAGGGEADRWRAEVQAGQLVNLAPLARLHPALAERLPRQGSVNATLAADGRWPQLKSEGSAHVEQLRAGTLALARADARWRFELGNDSAAATPVALQFEAAGMQLGAQRADQLRAELRGTLDEHRIEVAGALPLAPPPAVERLLGLQTGRGTRATMLAQGQWAGDGAGGGRWRARIERLAVGAWDGRATPVAAGAAAAAGAADGANAWADARELRAELGFDRQGTLRTLRAEPGRITLAGAIALRWDEVQADFTRQPATLRLRADIDPFALAPLLARAQPGFGWEGDLQLAARLDISAGERFDAEAVFERRSGDLHLAGGEGLQLLGLTEFRLALVAHDGVWDVSPVFSGRSLGEVRGSVRLRTTPERRWPHDDAPIEGQVQARVADLGIWSSWVPAGWRLAGELKTLATIGGRFAAPTYTGELSGQGLAVRNLLQGVNVRDGQLLVLLAGDRAQIERFSARAGDGSVRISGAALLGAEPSARLELVAERFRVLGRVDRQLALSGRADLALAAEASRLDGSFRVDEGLFDFSRADAPSLDNDVTIRDAPDDAERSGEAPPPRRARSFALGVDVDLGERLRARGRGVDTGLTGKLRITNPGGRLAVNGTVATERGTYAAYGQKLAIERGLIAFGGPVDNPRLDILAIRPNLDTRVGLAIGGTALAPRVRLFSEPEMSETDKLAWLLLGRAPDGLGRNDTALLQRAAVALLSGEGEAPTDKLMRNLGIDEFGLRQGEGDVRETVITLGKQLSRRWYLGYERGVNATTGTWQLIYRIAQRLTVRAQSGLENSLDIIWSWRLQEAPLEPGPRQTLPAKPP